jgi:hypothetical protein
MQKGETGTINAEAEAKKPNLTQVANIAIDEKGLLYVNWDLRRKEQTLVALAEAIKLVSTHKPNIIEPARPSFIEGTRNFLLGKKH